ncbi:MAG: class I SAM-dependent methyltransferase [Cohaesibacteraceae bacterium]|nr:class I SAM-dependent methyltransferase [Cohaesibacteraceae bacterium]
MFSTVQDAFFDAADRYDFERRTLVPCFDGLFGSLIECLGLNTQGDLKILDIGAGTGLLSGMISCVYPSAEICLIDPSRDRLEEAQRRFKRMMRPLPTVVAGDFSNINRGCPFNAVISSFAIHRLTDEEKQVLFLAIAKALKPGGQFAYADPVLGATQDLEQLYGIWWEREARSQGANDKMIAEAREIMRNDQRSTIEAQLKMLEKAGLVDVECAFHDHRFALITGVAPLN